MFELIELDPATMEEDSLVLTGTRTEVEARLAEINEDMDGEEEDGELTGRSLYRIQPAA